MVCPSAAIDDTFASRAESLHSAVFLRVVSDHTTSCGVRSCPPWNFTPSCSVNVYVSPTSDTVQSVASDGTMSCSGVRATRPW